MQKSLTNNCMEKVRPDQKWHLYCDTQEDYRKAYNCWKLALKRGHKDAKIEDYIKDRKKISYIKHKKSVGLYKNRMLRQFRITLATPKWVNFEEIFKIYDETPEGMHVDHIIPINGKNVSGLHVPWNLQYLPAKVNIKKGRKFN